MKNFLPGDNMYFGTFLLSRFRILYLAYLLFILSSCFHSAIPIPLFQTRLHFLPTNWTSLFFSYNFFWIFFLLYFFSVIDILSLIFSEPPFFDKIYPRYFISLNVLLLSFLHLTSIFFSSFFSFFSNKIYKLCK